MILFFKQTFLILFSAFLFLGCSNSGNHPKKHFWTKNFEKVEANIACDKRGYAYYVNKTYVGEDASHEKEYRTYTPILKNTSINDGNKSYTYQLQCDEVEDEGIL
jgi:hypothetical protein